MTLASKTLAAYGTSQTTFQAGDLLFGERAGVPFKITYANTAASIFPDDGVVTAKIADDAVTLAKIADAALSGADVTLVTGTAGTDGNLAQWNADGDIVDGPDVLDEDDFASNSASAVPTQQSVKAYVDAADAALGLTSASGQYFQSAETSITSNGDISIAHGLSAKPRVIVGVLVCKTTDQGYAVGDEIIVAGNSGSNTGITLAANATNIVGAFGTAIPVNAIGGTSGNITFGSWRLVVRAFL